MISIIAALAKNRVIGSQNKLPWHLPEDLKRFREITAGHPIVMGRKTYDSIGKPLPKRTNIVISRDRMLSLSGCCVVSSLEEALKEGSKAEVPGHEEVFVIGGAEIYRQAIAHADRLYLTRLEHDVQGDAFFPEFDLKSFREISREPRTEPFPFEFLVLERCR